MTHGVLNAAAQIEPQVLSALQAELERQQGDIELIASENFVSPAVMALQGSVMTNKYAEGYPGRRYYGGCQFVDIAETLAIDRLKMLFGAAWANVQPHSGSQANEAVFLGLIKPGDTILGMDLASGGHLTHGAAPNISGKWFHAVHYQVRPDTHRIDFDQVRDLALMHRPKLIIAGGSAYPRLIDFAAFRQIADEVGAYLMVDMAHFAGLVAGGVIPNPVPFADVVTSTTHKTLRGPRGGVILSRDADIGKKIDSAIFPGLQGGPLMHAIAAKAQAFYEALQPDFKAYAARVVDNAQALGQAMQTQGFDLVSGGTDTHLILVDLRSKGVTGSDVEKAMVAVHLTCNKNGVPYDPQPPRVTSGIRLGTPAMTTRGFGVAEFQQVAQLIGAVVDGVAKGNTDYVVPVQRAVAQLCQAFPIYTHMKVGA